MQIWSSKRRVRSTRRFETSHNCCHQERFHMFITTPIGATSTNFVVKRDLQNLGSTCCGSLRKSFWRHDMKNSQPHLNWIESDLKTCPNLRGRFAIWIKPNLKKWSFLIGKFSSAFSRRVTSEIWCRLTWIKTDFITSDLKISDSEVNQVWIRASV